MSSAPPPGLRQTDASASPPNPGPPSRPSMGDRVHRRRPPPRRRLPRIRRAGARRCRGPPRGGFEPHRRTSKPSSRGFALLQVGGFLTYSPGEYPEGHGCDSYRVATSDLLPVASDLLPVASDLLPTPPKVMRARRGRETHSGCSCGPRCARTIPSLASLWAWVCRLG